MFNYRANKCLVTLILLVAMAGTVQSQPSALRFMMDGNGDEVRPGVYSLDEDEWLDVHTTAGKTLERVQALEAGVQVICGATGVVMVSGSFIYEATRTDGTRIRVPRQYPSLSQNFQVPKIERFTFAKDRNYLGNALDFVILEGVVLTLRGLASAEALHPPAGGHPRSLVSVAGNTTESVLQTDLASFLKFDGNVFKFWRAARSDLDDEEKVIRGAVIEEGRVGAEAYIGFQKDTLAGMRKLREGYEMLQRNLYSKQVIEKMLAEGVAIPRLTLAEATIVRGDTAFSIRPFVNWQGEGRVLIDRAILQTSAQPPSIPPPAYFSIEDLSNRMLEKTMLLIHSQDSQIQTQRPGRTEWTLREPIQFDFDLRRTLFKENGAFVFMDELDANGFLARKDLPTGGLIDFSRTVIEKDRLQFRLNPVSADGRPGEQVAKFLDLRRMLMFPDSERRLQMLPFDFEDEQVAGFVDASMDHLAAEVHANQMNEILGFNFELDQSAVPVWAIELAARGENDLTVQTSHTANLPGAERMDKTWENLESRPNVTEWLELDSDFWSF